jgi:hypothetical protein
LKKTEAGQSLVETVILNALIVAGVIGIWSICQERVGEYIQSLLNLIVKPVP